MHIAQATSIPLVRIFDLLGYVPLHKNNQRITYASPFSKREKDLLQIDPLKNIWIDTGLNKRGNTLTFVCLYLQYRNEPHSIKDVLRWMADQLGYVSEIKPIDYHDKVKKETRFKIEASGAIQHRGLINFLRTKGIGHKLARRHLKQVRLYDSGEGQSFLALGLPNEDGGWELFNPYYQSYIEPRGVYFAIGRDYKSKGIHVFKNIFDYLSAIMQEPDHLFDESAMILNSFSLLPHITPYINDCGYSYAVTWMGKDVAAERATKSLDDFFRSQYGTIKHEVRAPLILPDPAAAIIRPMKCCDREDHGVSLPRD